MHSNYPFTELRNLYLFQFQNTESCVEAPGMTFLGNQLLWTFRWVQVTSYSQTVSHSISRHYRPSKFANHNSKDTASPTVRPQHCCPHAHCSGAQAARVTGGTRFKLGHDVWANILSLIPSQKCREHSGLQANRGTV